MIKSLNFIVKEFEEIQKAHLQLNSFYFGELNLALKDRSRNYPVMGVDYQTGNINELNTPVNFIMVIADRIYKDNSNLVETKSDTLQICRDIYNLLKKSPRWYKIGRILNANITTFVERGQDEIAGHVMTFTIEVRDSNGICSLPLDGYDYEGEFSFPCDPVKIQNSNNTFQIDITPGSTFILPNMEIEVQINGVFKQIVNLITLDQ